MNLVARQDRVLLGGLARRHGRRVRETDPLPSRSGAATSSGAPGSPWCPALIILTVVFVLHQQGRRQEAKGRATAAEAEAQQSGTRASEMERLVTFGQALGRSLDLDAIGDVVAAAPAEAGGNRRRLGDAARRRALAGAGRRARATASLTSSARASTSPIGRSPPNGSWKADAIAAEGHLCLPLTAGGHAVGVLGIPDSAGPFTDTVSVCWRWPAALLAISLRNAQLFHDVRENSLRDGLTGCFNRTHALDVIDMELRRARRSRLPVSLIMFDIDHFKEVNDRYGHLCGDAVLAAVGARMREGLRGSDLKCRYGGEEFLVLLPETPLEGAKRVADTLCRELAETPIAWKGETGVDHGELRRRRRASRRGRRHGADRPRRCGAVPRQGSGTQLRAAVDRNGGGLGRSESKMRLGI